ncbi:hypothetical protein [Mesobacillus selenatarsenatis]|uniref:Uncharacterized protein n=1 Tax=Mesobacillus selenatarsenatis (strain DSM 18680 / JCM 14380 / FERM P-15431 / SF-1) TaxID=1321606 RepID=A0A0A8WZX6_MESS1|nr:hypothetical protein [Mesobacillus selenatarsenatis]GAM13228.1 hypothetical protein SAMD00020551_1366 [Mesobacillus selenatarsenatis SF-1]
MQDLKKEQTSYEIVIEATAHAWRMPFVYLFEKLFSAGEAIRIGKTTLFVKDQSGKLVHQEYYGKSRKAAWYRKLEIEKTMKELSDDEFLKWLKNNNST